MAGLIGRKVGMTRVFNDEGHVVPVTVVKAGPCSVVSVKSDETDGYRAIQIGFEARKAKHATRATAGHAAKAGLEAPPRILREFRVADAEAFVAGEELTVEIFAAKQSVKVTGRAKGRGFQGVVKRHGFAGGPASHGHPMSRTPGSMGAGTDPSRVIKGKKLPGRMGGNRKTLRSVEVVRVDPERNLLFLKGAVPGARSGYVFISD
jgi:large subunit ribosomal protein L3